MAVARKRQKMRRTQISLTEEQFQRAKDMARRRGTSMSQLVRDGLDILGRDEVDPWDGLLSIIGMAEGTYDGSTTVDEVLYDGDPHS